MLQDRQRITPLWIIAAFVTLTEVVLGYAVTRTTSTVQIALTVFVILFAIAVAVAFFAVLWFRPFVFYAPSEYANVDPKEFITVMRDSLSLRAAEQLKLVSEFQQNPQDKDTHYALLSSVMDLVVKQYLILMYETGTLIPYEWDTPESRRHAYRYGSTRDRIEGSGHFDARDFVEYLKDTGYIQVIENNGKKISLTQHGREFAAWLVGDGRKVDYFHCQYGKWGDAPPVDLSGAL